MSIKKGSVTIASSVPTTEWGSIEGTLSDQTDIQNALNAKAPTLSPTLTGVPTAPTATDGTNTNQIATTKYVRTAITNAISEAGTLPEQTGQSGKYLTTDGTNASWATVDALPSQTGQAGKVLTTNGTTASWTAYSATPSVDGDTIHLNSSDELEVIGTIEKNAGDVKYDWIGTLAEWEAGRENQTIPDDWICYITDDFVPSTVTHNIGDIFYSLRTDTMFNGAVACDGTQYNIANYSTGTQSLKSLLDAGKLPYVSIADFNATVTANGSCRCFGYDGSSATVFKVPKLNDVFIEAGSANTANQFIAAGLPNITGEFGNDSYALGWGTSVTQTSSGAFTASSTTKIMGTGTASGESGPNTFIFDASDSNSIYGNSDTVQPNAVKYKAYIQLANATSESALQTVSSVVNDVEELKDEMEETIKYKNITNCITEIPQDIKLEVVNNVFKIKEGTKLYVPNGFEADGTTPKFDTVILNADKTDNVETSDTSIRLTYYNPTTHVIHTFINHSSGTTPPGSGTGNVMFYDLSDNIIKWYENGVLKSSGYSLPMAKVKGNGTIVNGIIEQVFNGFGYIGSTVFALPGVKGLIPNGRNEDGTLKNISATTNSVSTYTAAPLQNNYTYSLAYSSGGTIALFYNNIIYNELENKNYADGSVSSWGDVGSITTSSTSITSFIPKTTFHALDYNDKSSISKWAMPSDKYIDLTLGSSGTSYTAPANGYFALNMTHGDNESMENVSLKNTLGGQTEWTDGIMVRCFSTYRNGAFGVYIPVKKGDVVSTTYSATGGVRAFRFYYVEGEI